MSGERLTKARPRWRCYLITAKGYDPFVQAAPTRGKALSESWGRYKEVNPDASYREFLGRVSARVTPTPRPDGYDYVRRNYDVDVAVGGRVRLKDEGRLTGREGEVVYPGVSTAHVHVVLDGEAEVCRVHPQSVEVLAGSITPAGRQALKEEP